MCARKNVRGFFLYAPRECEYTKWTNRVNRYIRYLGEMYLRRRFINFPYPHCKYPTSTVILIVGITINNIVLRNPAERGHSNFYNNSK